jgi:Tol biopolymer transport system component
MTTRRSLAGSAIGTGVIAVLVVASVNAGLRVPDVEYLRGYPRAARVDVHRPTSGFARLAGRFIAKVLGVHDAGSSIGSSSASPQRDRVRPASPVVSRVTVVHPFTNDRFADAYLVPSVPFTARTDTRPATREANEPSSCSGVGGTEWYRFSPTRDRVLFATTFGSDHATAIGVFSGDRLGALTPIGCHSSATGNAQVGFPGRAGQTYYFQVIGVAGGGNTVFNLDPLGRTDAVSVSSAGEHANDHSYAPAISANSRYVAFQSYADNLTPDSPGCARPAGVPALDVGCVAQVFVHDRVTHATTLASVSSSGAAGDGNSVNPSISSDGRYVAFQSSAASLGAGGNVQVFVRDRLTGVTERVSDAAGGSSWPSISADGRYVAFMAVTFDQGTANCSLAPPTPCTTQIYVRDRMTQTTTRVSRGPRGELASGESNGPAMSADGTTVAFRSRATNLVPQDTDGLQDLFVYELRTGKTELVSVSTAGVKGNDNSGNVSNVGRRGPGYVSADGRYVAFQSEATNLVADDTNGTSDFFVRDRKLGTTVRVNLSSSGAQGRPTALTPESTAGGVAISDDGRYVAFDSGLLYDRDDEDNHPLTVYVRDLARGVTVRVSVSSLGEPGNYHSMSPALSGGGEIVAFSSSADNLVANDRKGGCVALATAVNCSDIFVHEMTEYTRPA